MNNLTLKSKTPPTVKNGIQKKNQILKDKSDKDGKYLYSENYKMMFRALRNTLK